MYKIRNKKLALLITIVFALTIMLPLAGPASAASSAYTALTVPDVDDAEKQTLGTVFAEIKAGQLNENDVVTFRLTDGNEFMGKTMGVGDAVYTSNKGSNDNYLIAPALYRGDDNALYGDTDSGNVTEDTASCLEVTSVSDSEIVVTVKDEPNSAEDAYFYLYLGKIDIDQSDGDVKLIVSSPSHSGFPTAEIIVGTVTGGDVRITVEDDESFSDTGYVELRFEETIKGSLEEDNESLKLKLPRGFEWTSAKDSKGKFKFAGDIGARGSVIWGADKDSVEAIDVSTKRNNDELILKVGSELNKATAFSLFVGITVADETKARTGDIEVKVSGKSDYSPDKLIVGTYGEYDVTLKVDETTEVYAGMMEQEIGTFFVNEDVGGSLIKGRTLTLELPSWAKWSDVPEKVKDGNATFELAGFPGTDGQTVKYEYTGGKDSAAEIEFDGEDFQIAIEPGVSGDLTVKVGGTCGLKGEEIVLAEVVPALTVTADATPKMDIGRHNQAAGTITIVEAAEEMLQDDADLILELPSGVKFSNVPKVEVTEGDLDIDEDGVTRKADDKQLFIPIDGKSWEASTIVISDVEYIVDRTVAEGKIEVKVKGDAVATVNNHDEVTTVYGEPTDDNYLKIGQDAIYVRYKDDCQLFPNTTTAARVANATVGTPAPSDSTSAGTFVIGSTTYTVDGVEQTMDVAPYVKDGRTFLPVRYAGYALGVAEENVFWDGKTATLMKGDRVVQFTIGEKAMYINGAKVAVDAPAEITNDRTMLPFRWIATAFGAGVDWDQDSQTVTFTR